VHQTITFTFEKKSSTANVVLYVDDFIVATFILRGINEVKEILGSQFKMKNMGRLHYGLGSRVVQDEDHIVFGCISNSIFSTCSRDIEY